MTNTTAALRDRLIAADPGITAYFPHLPTATKRSLILVAAQKAQQWAAEGTDPAELAAIVADLEQPEPADADDEQLIGAIAAARADATRHQQLADQHTATRDQLIRTAMTRRIRRTDIATAAGVAESRLYQIAKETTMLTITDIAAAVGMSSAPEKVARFAGCLTAPDPRTGRIPQPWHGQGMDALFTREQAERLIAEWHRAAADAEDGRIYPIVEADAGLDPAAAERRHAAAEDEVRERYRPEDYVI